MTRLEIEIKIKSELMNDLINREIKLLN